MDAFLKTLVQRLKDFDTGAKELNDYLFEFVSSNGKFVRSRLAYFCVMCFGSELNDSHLELISATELLHSASLIHDDIIDNADVRRRMPVLSKLYDYKLAVIVGDFLASIALNKINSLNNYQIKTLYLDTFSSMCTAEISQYFGRDRYSTLNEYLKKTEYKTAKLFAAILKGVSLLSVNMPPDDMYDLGLSFGKAFQIRNDLDDFITANSEDERNKIYTVPYIFMKEGLSKEIAIEKTIDLIDNEKKLAYSILQKFPQNEYENLIKSMIERL